MIQLGPLMIPCRRCKAPPGDDCRVVAKDDRSPLKVGVGSVCNPHRIRVRDAARTSELLDL